MTAPFVDRRRGDGGPKNLVRLLYLDEAGTSAGATWLCVAGVIVHGDAQWREADRRVAALVEKHIPAPDQPDFVFHATDIFHGSGYFDRKKPEWESREKRWNILVELAQIIGDLNLPVVLGTEHKADAAWHQPPPAELLHMWSAVNCLHWADVWLHAFAPDEMATVVHEDGANAKPLIKKLVRSLRHPNELPEWGSHSLAEVYGLPFEHIIDTVHFAEKSDARLLQLADLCAFMIGRSIQEKSVFAPVIEIIGEAADWARALRPITLQVDDEDEELELQWP